MEDPIEKMRKALEKAQTMSQLKRFAQKSEESRFEQDMNAFATKAVRPAFDKVKRDVFKEKLTQLPERPGDLGFKVADFPDIEFWFWIEIRGGLPSPQARRKYGKTPGAVVVATHSLCAKPNFALADVTEEDVVRAIADAYASSLSKI